LQFWSTVLLAQLFEPMIADIQLLLSLKPFRPFVIVTRNGQRHRVSSPEHAGINPRGSRVHVWFDDDTGVTISELQIVALEKESVSVVGHGQG
jgi:hypothetical protein